VDELSDSCLKLEVEKQQLMMTNCQMEKALQYRTTYVAWKYEELVRYLTTKLYRVQEENRVLRGRIDQTQLPEDHMSQPCVPPVEQGEEERGGELENDDPIWQEVARLIDLVATLTSEVNETKEQRDRAMAVTTVLNQKVIELEDHVARLTTEKRQEIQQKNKEIESNVVLSQEVTRLRHQVGEISQEWRDSLTILKTEKNELTQNVKDLSDQKDLIVETHDKAMALLTKQVDELTQANMELVRDKKLQGESITVLESQKTGFESQLKLLESAVADLTHDLDKVTKEKLKVEKLLEKAIETTKQRDEKIHQLQVSVSRADDKIKSLMAQVEELTEQRNEDKKRFEYEISLMTEVSNALQTDKEELVKKLDAKTKEEEQEREVAVRATTRETQPVNLDSGVIPSSQ
jgi:chromosome segregation ATPase